MSSMLLRDLGLADLDDDLRLVTATIVSVSDERARCVLRDGSAAELGRADWFRNRPFAPGQRFVAAQPGTAGELSATHPEVLRLLIESYVPEAAAGELRVMAVAREAGVRSKVAVAPTVAGVDAVGACVGKRSARVAAVAAALGGNERVEIVAWHPDPRAFIANALGPVGVVAVHQAAGSWVVVLPAHAFDAGVGGGAMNVKLASALTEEHLRLVPVGDPSLAGLDASDGARPATPEG